MPHLASGHVAHSLAMINEVARVWPRRGGLFPSSLTQAHRPRVAPSHHLVPRRRARAVSEKIVATAHATSDGDKNAAARAPATVAASGSAVYAPSSGVWDDSAKPPPVKTYESRLSSPGEHRRECCPYLFQRAMLVSEDGVRGGRDHLRSDEVGISPTRGVSLFFTWCSSHVFVVLVG